MEWKTEINEISNNVYKVTMTHRLGSVIEKTGIDIEIIKREALNDVTHLDKEIEDKIIKTNHNKTYK
jgi:hypothetical protein